MLDADPAHIKNILAHEVLHTCRGCQNHGKKWKMLAESMNCAYGYNITITSSYEKMGLDRHEKKTVYRYAVQCQKCGKVIYRQRKSKLITHPDHYRCICGGKLKLNIIEKDR